MVQGTEATIGTGTKSIRESPPAALRKSPAASSDDAGFLEAEIAISFWCRAVRERKGGRLCRRRYSCVPSCRRHWTYVRASAVAPSGTDCQSIFAIYQGVCYVIVLRVTS